MDGFGNRADHYDILSGRASSPRCLQQHIVTEFFDIDKSRLIPPQRRPGQRASQRPPRVQDSGGGKATADILRQPIKIRIRAAMAAQAQIEGRYLGGPAPYGHQLTDAGPHLTPAKAKIVDANQKMTATRPPSTPTVTPPRSAGGSANQGPTRPRRGKTTPRHQHIPPGTTADHGPDQRRWNIALPCTTQTRTHGRHRQQTRPTAHLPPRRPNPPRNRMPQPNHIGKWYVSEGDMHTNHTP